MAFMNHNRSRAANFQKLDFPLVIRHDWQDFSLVLGQRVLSAYRASFWYSLVCLQLLDVNLAGTEGCVWLNNSSAAVV